MEGMGCLVIKQTYGKSNDIELTFLILNLYIWNIKKNRKRWSYNMHPRLTSIIKKDEKHDIQRSRHFDICNILYGGFYLQMTITGEQWGVFMNRIYHLTVIAQTPDHYIPQHWIIIHYTLCSWFMFTDLREYGQHYLALYVREYSGLRSNKMIL